MRINIRQLKSLSWLACVAAFGLAGYTFWDIYQGKKVENRYEAKEQEYFDSLLLRDVDDSVVMKGPTQYPREEYERIWMARIDGSKKPPPKGPDDPNAQKQDEKPKINIPPLTEVVQVSMLLWSQDPGARIAAVEYIKDPPAGKATPGSAPKEKRLHLAQGEPLAAPWGDEPYNGKVVRIEKQEVVFRWDQGEVTLTPGLGTDGEGRPIDEVEFADADAAWEGYDELPEESERLEDGSWIMGTKDRALLQEGGGSQILESQVAARSITPSGGGRSFVELTNVEPDSMPARFGFQSGDRIISVNGHPMGSIAEAINWGKQNPDLPQYVVVWERKGVQQQSVFHWKEQGS